jgi:hypothetical protein
MENMLKEIFGSIGTYLPSLIGAVAILIIGWILAMIIAGAVRGVLRRVGFNRRMSHWTGAEQAGETPDVENGIAKGIYYLLMLFVLVAFFQTLRITLITEPLTGLLNQVFQYVPKLIGAVVLLGTAWVIAKLLQIATIKILQTVKLDQRLAGSLTEEERPVAISKSIGDAVYGLVLLLFLPGILGALSLEGLLAPVQGLMNKVLEFLPNLVIAGVIMFFGWFVARLVQKIVTNLLAAVGTDRLSEKTGLASVFGTQKLSGVIGLILYVLMLIPVAIAALNTLQLESVTRPASNMLNMILAALPNIFAAAVVIVVSYALGRMAAALITNLLAGIGFDNLAVRLGLTKKTPEGAWTPSRAVGSLALLAIVFFSVLEASRLLGFGAMADLISHFMLLAGHIILGLAIFALGMAVANIVATAVRNTGIARAEVYASVSRVAILIFAGAMALRQMGLANDIINLAFGLLLGAVAVAIAIAFGLGARDIAARELDHWLETMKSGPK